MAATASPWRAFAIRFTIALALVVALTGAAVAAAYWETNRQVDSIEEVQISGLDSGEGIPPEGGNFVVIGSDSRESGVELVPGDEELIGSQRSDTLMVAHVDPSQKTGLLVSFPRDLFVEIPGYGTEKINAAYTFGGEQLVIDTLKANFDVPISHYVEVDFAGFEGIVDAVGGVPVYFPGYARDEKTGFANPFGRGCIPLDGRNALAYVRSRNYEQYEGGEWVLDGTGDLGRTERQRDFMRRLASTALADVGANPLEARELADEALSHIKKDETLGTRDILSFIDTFRVVDPNSESFEDFTFPTEVSGSGLRPKQPEADALLARLRQFGPTPETPEAPPPPDIDPFTVTVEVLNGTQTSGLAGGTSGALAEQGFATAGVADAAEKGLATSEVRYAPGDEGKAQLVLSYLGGAGTLVEDSSVSSSDVVLVLGTDFVGVAPPDQVGAPAPVESPPAESGEPPEPEGEEEQPIPEEEEC